MGSSEDQYTVELIERIKIGDVEAEGELWSKYRRGVRFLVLRKVFGRQEVAEDIEQEVFLALQKALRTGRLSDPRRLGSYIQQICSNLAARWWEREKRPASLESVGEPHTDVNPESIGIDRETTWRLRSALRAMRPTDRQILALRYGEEWNYRRIGAFLDLTEETARKRASRAIARLEVEMRAE
jgi:RNA polymerase sigma-70 factor (ECF subfamily)